MPRACCGPRTLPLLLCTAFLIPLTQLPASTSPLRLIHLPWSALVQYALSPALACSPSPAISPRRWR